MRGLGKHRTCGLPLLAACVLLVLALASADAVRADDPPAARPSQNTAGGMLGGVRPPLQTRDERAEQQVADELAEVAGAPGHEAATGALTQTREALARARDLRVAGEPAAAARALAVARAAVELAGRQAALARERTAASAAGRTREAARARATAAREALVAAQRERVRAAQAPAPTDAPANVDDDGGKT